MRIIIELFGGIVFIGLVACGALWLDEHLRIKRGRKKS